MAPPAGRMTGPRMLPIQIRVSQEVLDLTDALVDALSRQSMGASFSRSEALRLAAESWLREWQAGGKVGAPPFTAATAPGVVSDPDEALNLDLDADPQPPAQTEDVAPGGAQAVAKKKGGRPSRR
jgi:hypothetical protein